MIEEIFRTPVISKSNIIERIISNTIIIVRNVLQIGSQGLFFTL